MPTSTTHRSRLLLVASLTTIAMFATSTSAANAAERASARVVQIASPASSNLADESGRQLTSNERANLIALLTATTDGDARTFSPTKAAQLGATTEAIKEYSETFVKVGGTIEGTHPSLQAVSLTPLASSCRGRNGYTGTYWFGVQYAANSCNTQSLIDGITLAAAGGGTYAAAAALTGIGLPAGGVIGLVSAILVLGATFLSTCRNASSVKAIYLNTGAVTPPSCWAQ